MSGLKTLSDTTKKNLKITDKKKKARETFIHSSSPSQILSDSTSGLSLMFSTGDYISDTGFL